MISFIHSLHLSLGLMFIPDREQNLGHHLMQSMLTEGYVLNTVINSADSHTFYEENKAGWWGRDWQGWGRLSHQLLAQTLREDLLGSLRSVIRTRAKHSRQKGQQGARACWASKTESSPCHQRKARLSKGGQRAKAGVRSCSY